MSFESLETRTLLAAHGIGDALDFAALRVDSQLYDAASILVRWEGGPAPAEIVPGAGAHRLAPWLPDLYRVSLPSGLGVDEALEAFRGRPQVKYAEPDYRVYIAAVPDDPGYSDTWSLENVGQTGGAADADIDASRAWDVHTGSGGEIVAVIDTGVDYTHPDLAANMWVNSAEAGGLPGVDDDGNGYVDDIHGYDFYNGDGNPHDDNGHGTHVAGTIGAAGDNGLGVTGINWDVQIMALKFLGADGSGTSSDAIEAINYAVANGARISNNSWGGDPYSQAMFDTIAAARDAGHVFVAAAGNGDAFGFGIDNDAAPFYPAGYELDNIIAVAATDYNDDLAGFSNYGATTVDIAAPGVNILSTTPGGNYGHSSGTSMAAPHATGVAALAWDAHPEWSYQQLVAQVLASAEPLPELQGVVATGGRLNAAAALGNPEPPPSPPPAGMLPVWDDFQDGVADYLAPQAGNWSVGSGRYNVSPVVDNADLPAISTLQLDAPLPDNVEIQATLNADEGRIEIFGLVVQDYLTNAFLVFDYHGFDDFKFAGADMRNDRWVIGHRHAAGWAVDAMLTQTLDAGTNYQARLVLENGHEATLFAGGVEVLSHTYAASVTDGDVGVGMRNSIAHFDHFAVQPYTPPTPATLPLVEDFDDGAAQNLLVRTGLAAASGGQLHVTPLPGGDGISTVVLSDPLPANVEVAAVINVDDATGGRLSNAFVIFDYHGPSDFKFAGAYAGVDQWVIGHRDAAGWTVDAAISAPIDALTDYAIRAVMESNGRVTLLADGVERVSHHFSGVLTDGEVGLGTWNALGRFDDLLVQEYVPPPSATLPHTEDFDDGVADFFDIRAGAWAVNGGRYEVTPETDVDGVSLLRLDNVPASLEATVTFNADDAVGGRFSNAFIVFDYQSPTDFKFAGSYVASDQWLIGRRTGSGWITDAVVSAPLAPLTDYELRIVIENDSQVTLYADGAPQMAHTFADSLSDGKLGLGTRDAIARFDDLDVRTYGPPPATPGALPLAEDFDDGVAEHVQLRTGLASISDGVYHVTPLSGGDGISTVLLADPLPANVEIATVINVDDATTGRLSNGLVIFDYHGPSDFKFAGAYAGVDQWVIGHRDGAGWTVDAAISAPIDTLTDYAVRTVIESGGRATLWADGVERVSFQFADELTDGEVGLGTWNALARFDDLRVEEFTPPTTTTLPHAEDFDDGVADFFDVRAGAWSVNAGRYEVTPETDGDGISTLRLGAVPASFVATVTFNADDAVGGRFSNAFIVFDYQSPTDFKFAGSYVGSDQWLIGRRTASGWITDAVVTAPLAPLTDYDLRVVVENDSQVTLYADGVPQLAHTYASPLSDGKIGLGTRDAITRFDNLDVRAYAPPPVTPGALPLSEDFEDGVADHVQLRSGLASVSDGLYHVAPLPGGDGISTVLLSDPLPANVEVHSDINVNDAATNRLSNGLVIFDYHGPADFKFAGAYAGVDQWVIGHRDAAEWTVDAAISAPIDALTNYAIRAVIESSGRVTLWVDGVERVSHQFSDVLTDGEVGLGTWNALARLDNLAVQEFTPPPSATLPHAEDFDDGVADLFDVRTGAWSVAGGRYGVLPATGADGVSTLRSERLPASFEATVTFNADPAASGRFSNAFIIFDYQSPSDFKFAGAYVGADEWVIGHRSSGGWFTDALAAAAIDAQTDYVLSVTVKDSTQVTLRAGGAAQVSYTFGATVVDGAVGLGTRNAVSRFDDLAVEAFSAGIQSGDFGGAAPGGSESDRSEAANGVQPRPLAEAPDFPAPAPFATPPAAEYRGTQSAEQVDDLFARPIEEWLLPASAGHGKLLRLG